MLKYLPIYLPQYLPKSHLKILLLPTLSKITLLKTSHSLHSKYCLKLKLPILSTFIGSSYVVILQLLSPSVQNSLQLFPLLKDLNLSQMQESQTLALSLTHWLHVTLKYGWILLCYRELLWKVPPLFHQQDLSKVQWNFESFNFNFT